MHSDLDGCPKIDDRILCRLHQNAQKLQNLKCAMYSVQCTVWAKCIWYALCIMCTSDRQMLCNNVLKIMVNDNDSWFLAITTMQLFNSNWMLPHQMLTSIAKFSTQIKQKQSEMQCKAIAMYARTTNKQIQINLITWLIVIVSCCHRLF